MFLRVPPRGLCPPAVLAGPAGEADPRLSAGRLSPLDVLLNTSGEGESNPAGA